VSDDVGKVERFKNETADAVRENCVGYDAARRIVEQRLSRYGLAGWTVEATSAATPYSAANPCSSIAVVFEHHLVYIEAIEPAYPGQPVPSTQR